LSNKNEFDYKKYFIELEKAKSRNFSELFYESEDNNDIQNFTEDSRKEILYEYGAKVLEYRENGYSTVEIKNKISVGDYMELMVPYQLKPIGFTVDSLMDYESNSNIDYINPGREGQKVLMKLPQFAERNYVIRRKK
jgi:hypothetical protein